MLKTITLGSTNLTVTATAFGALPIQRISQADAVALLRKAYNAGVNFFDTARAYSGSRLNFPGKCLSGRRTSGRLLKLKA